MVPSGGLSSKYLMPELQPLWFGGKINIAENPHSHLLNDYKPSGFIKDSRLLICVAERDGISTCRSR
jgi:hypothetical protein